uniref:Uncharacterized protein n=1 Tax=Nelumbo nucifera TaxID=4432 RepID=A0A822YSN8_NELNU|nr:TPA_asm: hypothetical protein HUJ06_007795 [Nelumbo nucifera]
MSHPQFNLFPLHPENLLQEKDVPDQDNVNYFFHDDGGGGATLNGLLGGCAGDGSSVVLSSDEDSLSPSSLTYTYSHGTHNSDEGVSSLAHTALRHHQGRNAREERWVFYSEVVEIKDEEVSSCDAAADLQPWAYHH